MFDRRDRFSAISGSMEQRILLNARQSFSKAPICTPKLPSRRTSLVSRRCPKLSSVTERTAPLILRLAHYPHDDAWSAPPTQWHHGLVRDTPTGSTSPSTSESSKGSSCSRVIRRDRTRPSVISGPLQRDPTIRTRTGFLPDLANELKTDPTRSSPPRSSAQGPMAWKMVNTIRCCDALDVIGPKRVCVDVRHDAGDATRFIGPLPSEPVS